MKSEAPKKPRAAKKPANGKSAPAAAPVKARAKAVEKTAVAAAPAKRPAVKTARGVKARPALKIPPILLEGDEASVPKASGPGQRFAVGAELGTRLEASSHQELPEAYGTQRLLLTARDPHWLYAHWDLTLEQLRRYNSRSVHRHLVLRIFKDAVQGLPHREIHVHPESRNWFAHVALGGTKFVGQLGYYRTETEWVPVSTSSATITPPDAMSNDLSVWFETMPVELTFEQVLALVKQAVSDNVPLMEALQQLRASGYPGLPDLRRVDPGQWTPEQDRALAQVISMDAVRRVWMGSLEITELLRRQFLQELSSISVAQLGGSWSGAVSSISIPYGVGERKKGFWFNVNAELIIYGATEPDAHVTIGGRQIRLRPDGTFSYRFSLPDGQYDLPAVATSSDGSDSRSAGLKFSRSTQYRGDVQAHPQDAALKPPLAANVA